MRLLHFLQELDFFMASIILIIKTKDNRKDNKGRLNNLHNHQKRREQIIWSRFSREGQNRQIYIETEVACEFNKVAVK